MTLKSDILKLGASALFGISEYNDFLLTSNLIFKFLFTRHRIRLDRYFIDQYLIYSYLITLDFPISGNPMTVQPISEKPSSENPTTVKPYTVNPYTVKLKNNAPLRRKGSQRSVDPSLHPVIWTQKEDSYLPHRQIAVPFILQAPDLWFCAQTAPKSNINTS